MRFCKANVLRLALDLVLYSTMGILILVSILGPIAPPYFRVSCHDQSLKMPYQANTISIATVVIISLGLPFIVMTVLEWAVPPENNCTSPLRQGLRRSWYYLVDLFIGGLFMYFVNELTKVTTGSPRPSFLNSCAPSTCAQQDDQPYISLSWRNCSNPKGLSPAKLVDAMKSFPSGHASISVFSSIFMIVYFKQRLWNKCSKLIAPWLQLVWVTWAIICCVSRVWDNQHHVRDVVAGSCLGAFGAYATLKYLSNWFIREEDLVKPGGVGPLVDPNYAQQNHGPSRFSHTSIKRLISTTSETENHLAHRLDDRELSDINGHSFQMGVFSSVQL